MPTRVRRKSPLNVWTLIGILAAATLAVFTHNQINAGWLEAWLISINLAALMMFGIDKIKAQNRWIRIPEDTLLTLVLVGGSLGALAGMVLFQHKVSKRSFQNAFWTVVTLQIVVLCIWYFVAR